MYSVIYHKAVKCLNLNLIGCKVCNYFPVKAQLWSSSRSVSYSSASLHQNISVISKVLAAYNSKWTKTHKDTKQTNMNYLIFKLRIQNLEKGLWWRLIRDQWVTRYYSDYNKILKLYWFKPETMWCAFQWTQVWRGLL